MANAPYWDEGFMRGMGEFPQILAYGDSWFWYPLNNLLNPIWNLWAGQKVIFAIGDVGMEAEELGKSPWLTRFRHALKGYPTIEAVLISAGGNDFAGADDLSKIVASPGACRNAATGAQCFDAGKLEQLMFGAVLDAYRKMIHEVAAHRGNALVFVHNYDYALPSGQGFLGFGKWLKYPLDLAQVPGAIQPLAVNHLIDTFSEVLAQVQREFADRVLLVDSSGVLSPGDWANELHPTIIGFNKVVAEAWQKPLLDNLP